MNRNTNLEQQEPLFENRLLSKQKCKAKYNQSSKKKYLFHNNDISQSINYKNSPVYLTKTSNNSIYDKKLSKDIEIIKDVIKALSEDARRLSTEMKNLKNKKSRSKFNEDKLSWEIHFINSNIKKLSNDKKILLKELKKASNDFFNISHNKKRAQYLCLRKESILQRGKILEKISYYNPIKEPGQNIKVRSKNIVSRFNHNFSNSQTNTNDSRKLPLKKTKKAFRTKSKNLTQNDFDLKKEKPDCDKVKSTNNDTENYLKSLEKNEELKDLFAKVNKIVQFIDSLKENNSQSNCIKKSTSLKRRNIKQNNCAAPKKTNSETSKSEAHILSKNLSKSCPSNSIYNGPMSEYIEQVSGSINKLSNSLDKVLSDLGKENLDYKKRYRETKNSYDCCLSSNAVLDLISNIIRIIKNLKCENNWNKNFKTSVLENLMKSFCNTSLKLQTLAENRKTYNQNSKLFLMPSDSENKTSINKAAEHNMGEKNQKFENKKTEMASFSIKSKQKFDKSKTIVIKNQLNTHVTPSHKISTIVNWFSKFLRPTVSALSKDKLLNYNSAHKKHDKKDETIIKTVKLAVSPSSSQIDTNSLVYNSNAKLVKLKSPKKCNINLKCKGNEKRHKNRIKVQLIPNKLSLNSLKEHKLKKSKVTRRLQVKLSFSEIESDK